MCRSTSENASIVRTLFDLLFIVSYFNSSTGLLTLSLPHWPLYSFQTGDGVQILGHSTGLADMIKTLLTNYERILTI